MSNAVRGSQNIPEKTKVAFYNNSNDPRHGSANGYTNLGCRCQRCKAAWAIDHREYMHRKPKQQERNNQYMRTRTALKSGYSSREAYEHARKGYLIECPFCDWTNEAPASWIDRGVLPGYTAHVRNAHPPKVGKL